MNACMLFAFEIVRWTAASFLNFGLFGSIIAISLRWKWMFIQLFSALINGGDGGMGAAAAAAAAQNQVTYVNQLSIQLAAAAAGLSFPNPAVALLGGPGALDANKY